MTGSIVACGLLTSCALHPQSAHAPSTTASPTATSQTAPDRRATSPLVLRPIVPDDGHGPDPRLLAAFAAAQSMGAAAGFTFSLNSSYRPPADQQHLLDEAVTKYGTVDEAMRWVMTPWDSAHVRGMAIDVQGTPEGHAWLWQNQARFGLCRRYDNEPWHFELQASFPDNACPPMRPSAGAS